MWTTCLCRIKSKGGDHGRRARVPPCDPAGVCAFLALLLHALEIQNLRMKPSPPQFSVQWPYYVLGFAIVLFIVAGAICLFQETACLSCHWLPNSRSIEETQGIPHLENLESLGGDLSSIQKETLLKEETVI